MIKASTKDTVILGLSDENLKRLKLGQPIKFNLSDLGHGDIEVFIFNGKDESAMINLIKDKIGPETKII